MKQFFKWLGKHIAGAMVFSLFSILFILGIVYALSYPSAPPVGEVAGGKFMQYFNSIKVACPDGQYLNGYDANFNKVCAVAMTGATGSPGSTGPTGNTGPAGTNGGLMAALGGVLSDGTLWNGTERCINATNIGNTILATGCMRINNNVVETKMTGQGVANTSWIAGSSNPSFTNYYTCTNMCGQAGNNVSYRIYLNAHGFYHAPKCGCSIPVTPSFF